MKYVDIKSTHTWSLSFIDFFSHEHIRCLISTNLPSHLPVTCTGKAGSRTLVCVALSIDITLPYSRNTYRLHVNFFL